MPNTKPEFRKTLLIGLGGAGQQIVLRTKRFFLDTYGVVPPSVKILCLDTDDEALKMRSQTHDATYAIEPSEFMHLKVDDPPGFIRASKTVQDWYVGEGPVSAISHGAGAVRQNGRLAFFHGINEIRQRIDILFAELNDVRLPHKMASAAEALGSTTDFALSHDATEIYVCGSVAGGTGSGTFIDCGLLLRAKEHNANIHGFFLLPWVYRNKSFAYRTRQNAYAALAELDNLQSVMFDDDTFYQYEIDYGDLHVKVNKAPYDLFHVIDGRNDFGQNIDNVHDLCDVVANAVFLSMGSMSIPIKSVNDNLASFLGSQNPKVWNNRYARYSSLGISSLHYPAQELHRWIGAVRALEICREARRRLESGADASAGARVGADIGQQASQDVDQFNTQLNLHRNNVQAKLCPRRSPVPFQLEAYEIADADFASLLKNRLAGETTVLAKALAKAAAEGQGPVFLEQTLRSLRQAISRIDAAPELDRTYRRDWGQRLFEHVSGLRDEAAKDLNEATEKLHDLERDADGLFEIVEKSSYIPWIGGHRKSAANAWAERAGDLLTARQTVHNLEQEKACYERLLILVDAAKATSVPAASEILKALLAVEARLQQRVSQEGKGLEVLRTRPNHVLLGNGNTFIVPYAGKGDTAGGQRILSSGAKDLGPTYEEFVKDEAIHSAERYVDLYRESPDQLEKLFLGYCMKRLDYIPTVTANQALETLALESGDPDGFLHEQFDHLIRLAAPLWRYERGRLNAGQEALLDKVINIGLQDCAKDLPTYGQIADDAKFRFHIRSNLSFSTTGDPHRVWMLCYGAALPAYYLDGMTEAKRLYEEQISPTYHIDRRFEMNVPDLMPEGENANLALRLLGMAIVQGIGVIGDEKLNKGEGHEFTFDNDAVRALNFGEPLVWRLFRDLYADMTSNVDGLLDILRQHLVQRVQGLDPATLRSCIEQHIAKLEEKLAHRDFSRLVSARLTYREINALKDFLNNRRFGMDMERYRAGTYVVTRHGR
jgi:hypothetical protein